jgi:hypothetical protein
MKQGYKSTAENPLPLPPPPIFPSLELAPSPIPVTPATKKEDQVRGKECDSWGWGGGGLELPELRQKQISVNLFPIFSGDMHLYLLFKHEKIGTNGNVVSGFIRPFHTGYLKVDFPFTGESGSGNNK